MSTSDSKLLTVYTITHFVIHCPGSIFVALITLIIANYDINLVQFGLIVSIINLVSSFSSPVAGVLADRFGRRIFPSLSSVLTGITALIIGVFGGRSFTLFIGGLLILTFSVTLFHPSTMTMISNRFYYRRSGSFSIFQSGGQIGVGTGPLTVAILLWMGRNNPFLAYLLWSVPLLFMSVVMIIMHLRDPNIGASIEKDGSLPSNLDEPSPSLPSAIKLLTIPAFLILLLALSLDSFGSGLYRNYLIPFLIDERQIQEATAVFYFAILKLFGFPGTLLGGFAGDKYGEKRVLIAAYILVTLGLILLILIQSHLLLLLIFLMLAFGLNATMPTSDSLTAKIIPLKARGKAYGISYFTQGLGIVAPTLGAIIILVTGYGLIFFIAISLYVLVTILLFFIRVPSDP